MLVLQYFYKAEGDTKNDFFWWPQGTLVQPGKEGSLFAYLFPRYAWPLRVCSHNVFMASIGQLPADYYSQYVQGAGARGSPVQGAGAIWQRMPGRMGCCRAWLPLDPWRHTRLKLAVTLGAT